MSEISWDRNRRYCIRFPDGTLEYLSTRPRTLKYVADLAKLGIVINDITDCKTGAQVLRAENER